MTAMEQPQGSASGIGEMIRAKRLEMNISQGELAQQIGSHVQTIHKIENGIIKYSRYFGPIGRLLDLDIPETPWPGPWPASPALVNGPAREVPAVPSRAEREVPPVASRVDLQIYRAAPHERDARLTVIEAKAVGYTARLHCLQNISGAYAFPIVTSVMAPAFEIGDEVQVNPFLPPEPGRDVVLYAAKSHGARPACVARLTDIGVKSWTLVQWGGASERKLRPFRPQEFTLARGDYPQVHIIVGKKMRWNS